MKSSLNYSNANQEAELVEKHRHDDVRKVALAIAGRKDIDRDFVVTQIAGYQAVEKKIPSWKDAGLLFPPHLSMEQCSSELTARYKASLCSGDSLTDLTGGFGVDFAFMSAGFSVATYVEQQESLCQIADANFRTLLLKNSVVVNSSAVNHLESMENQDWIYLDPARRNDAGGKTVLLQDCSPDITQLYGLLLSKCGRLMVKLSPMLDISLALKTMRFTSDIHIVSVDNECKELLFISGQPVDGEPVISCVNLSASKAVQLFVFSRDEEAASDCNYSTVLGKYLYEPNSSIMKSGAFRLVASRYGLGKLHQQSHLYTSDSLVEDFPGRVFEVLSVHTFSRNDVRELRRLSPSANIAIRNYPGSVSSLRRQLAISEGGSDYLFATTIAGDKRVIVRCQKTAANG